MSPHQDTWYGAILLGIRFLLELGALAALAFWGFSTGRGTAMKVVLGVGAPVLVASVWGLFISPKAPIAVPGGVQILLEVAVFGAATIALFAAGRPILGWTYGAVAVANTVLVKALGL